MALNAVDQHKGAIVRPARNNSNAYNSGDPLGNATGGGGGSAPAAVNDLAVDSIGSSSASLSWTLPANTDNIEVYQRDVTAAGSFALIATLGAVSSYNATGLTSENQYEWKVVATNANGSSADSNTVSGTTTAQGAVYHGSTYTITGSGFGTKPDYNSGGYTIGGQTHIVARSTDFDSATTQEPASNTKTGWQNHLDGIYPIITSKDFNDEATLSKATLELSGGPGQSGRWLKRVVDQDVFDLFPNNGRLRNFNLWDQSVAHGNMYASVHVRVQQTYSTGKYIRFYWTGGDVDNRNIWLAKGDDSLTIQARAEHGGGGTPVSLMYADEAQLPDDQWARLEFLVDFSAGTVSMYSNGVPIKNEPEWGEVLDGWVGVGGQIDYFLLGNTIANIADTGGRDVGWALPYLDFSFKRVELTNSATWGSETKKVVQTPYSWSDTSIGVVINQGDFPSLSGLYLHVIDGAPGAMTSIHSEAL